MKHNSKKFAALFACLAVTAAVAGVSGCSMFLQEIEGDGGGSGVSGTYTLDVEVLDAEWYKSVVDSAMWSITAGIDAYATDTLTLNEDGTYVLIKEMGAGPEAIDRWGGGSETNFSRYEYRGTYQANGNTVTLSAATSAALEVTQFSMSAEQMGDYSVPYTETTDLTTDAGTSSGDITLADIFYGPYIVASDHGNAQQSVTLGTYEYGTFTFNDASSEPEDPENPDDPGDVPDTRPSYAFKPGKNEAITFNLYTDGTYTFAWPDQNVEESGTYTWNRVTQTLVITDPADKTTTVTAENGELAFTYVYSQSDQLTQDYTGNVADLEAVICSVAYSMIPTAVGDISLDLYADNTYTFTDATNATAVITETGTYDWDSTIGSLILTAPGTAGKTFTAEVSGNILSVEYTCGNSVQSFIGSLADMRESLPSAVEIYSLIGKTNNLYSFTFYDDFTYLFYDGQHGISDYGTWTFEAGKIALTADEELGEGVTAVLTEYVVEGDIMSFVYVYSGAAGLNQPFEGSVSALAKAMVENGMVEKIYTFENDEVEGINLNEDIQFSLYEGGIYEFSYVVQVVYSGAEYGVYNLVENSFSVTDALGQVTAAAVTEDGTITFTYHLSNSEGLIQAYTGTIFDIQCGMIDAGLVKVVFGDFGHENIYDENGEITNGANPDLTLQLFANGIYKFAYSLYGYTGSEFGMWSFDSNIITLVAYGTDTAVVSEYEVVDGKISFIYTAAMSGGAIKQKYTADVYDINKAMVENGFGKALYAFEPQKSETITLTLYEGGVYVFNFNMYGYVITEYGTWSFEGTTLTLESELTPGPGVTDVLTLYSVNGDVISFTYEYSQGGGQLDQPYVGSVAELTAAIQAQQGGNV